MNKEPPHTPASLARILASFLYDSFLVIACIIVSTLLWVVVTNDAVKYEYMNAFRMYLFLVVFLFFTYFWHKKGQTLGMLAWKIKVVDHHGNKISFARASIRFFLATIFSLSGGLTFIWKLLDPNSLSLHDRVSGTNIISIK